MNLEEILSFVLPKVHDHKQEEALQVIRQTFAPESPGFFRTLLSTVGVKQHLPEPASMLAVLLTMIKPEHIADVQNYFAKLFRKNENLNA